MTPEQWQRVEAAFDEAVALTGDARAKFVAEFGTRDPELVERLKRLLAADEREVDLEAPLAANVAALSAQSDDPWVGKVVGAWTVVERIAAGGMGAVFLAERTDPQYRQRAAIKIMSAQLLAEDAAARFRAERQILASLNHRYIARLLDGGSTDSKLPYLVMEYVDGLPVDDYCDEQRLDVDARLRLFVNICDAVGYAHRSLIVHRDLKPSNILVNTDGEPRLLDFGIAKLLEGGVDVGTVAVTRQGVRVMTPEYASPEQVSGGAVTVATDIYALGVLLYRLLSGHHPYADQLTTSASAERAICQTDPRPPSARAQTSTQDGSPERLAEQRQTTSARLIRSLRGDLDNIVLKAMRKEPERRYESARHLADDIERYLDRQPVRAHPPLLSYRLSKFLRRNTVPVVASALAAVAFAATITFYTLRVTSERDRAQLEAAKAQQVSDFVAGLFRTASPDESLGETITARELLDQGVRRLDELDSQPEIQAAMQDVIGTAYRGLGLYDTSIALLEQASQTRARILGTAHGDTLTSLGRLGGVMISRGQLEAAEGLFRDMLSRTTLADTDDLLAARANHGLGLALSAQSRFDDARPHFERARELLEAAEPGDSFALASLLDDYGRFLSDVGEDQRALGMLRRAIALFKEARGDGHPSYLNALQNLGYTLIWGGRLDDADAIVREMRALSIEVYGPEHPFSVGADSMSGTVFYERGDYASAEALYRSALERFEAIFGDGHPESSIGANNLATALSKLGRYREAEHYYRLGLDRNRRIHGEEHIEVATSYSNLGVFLTREGQLDEAEAPILRGLEIRSALLGEDHPNTLTSVSIYASYLRQSGDIEAATALSRKVRDARVEKLGPDHPLTGREYGRYGILLRDGGDIDGSKRALDTAIEVLRAAHAGAHEEVADAEIELARTLAAADQPAEAEELFRAALAQYEKSVGREHPQTASALLALGEFLLDVDRVSESLEALRAAHRIRTGQFAASDWRLSVVDSAIGAALLRSGDCARGRQALKDSHAALLAARGPTHRLVRRAAERLNLTCTTPVE